MLSRRKIFTLRRRRISFMKIYTIADLHLSFSVGRSKSMEIFDGWQNYERKLEHNWKKLVSHDDVVVIIGDLSWSMDLNEAYADFCFLNNLPGKKILIKGNHDYWWSSKKKIETYLKENNFSTISILHNSSERCGKYAICGTRGWFLEPKNENDSKVLNREVGRLQTSILAGKDTGLEPLVFMHYPPIYDNFKCEEIMKVLVENKIKRCYYGHVHGKFSAQKAKIGEYRGISFFLVACDRVDFTPVLVA